MEVWGFRRRVVPIRARSIVSGPVAQSQIRICKGVREARDK